MSGIEIQVVPHIHTMQRDVGVLNNQRVFEFFKHQLDQNLGNTIVLFLEYTGTPHLRDLIVYTDEFYKRLFLPKNLIRQHRSTSMDDSKETSESITHIQENRTGSAYNPEFFEYYEELDTNNVVEEFGFLLFLIHYYTQEYTGPTKLKFEKSFEGTTIRSYDIVIMEIQLELNELFERNNVYGDGIIRQDDVVYLLLSRSRSKLKDYIINFLQTYLHDTTYEPQEEFLKEIIEICSKENRLYILDESREYLTVQYMQDRMKKIYNPNDQYYLVFGRLHHFQSWNDYLMEHGALFHFQHIVLNAQEERDFPKHKKIKNPIHRVHKSILEFFPFDSNDHGFGFGYRM